MIRKMLATSLIFVSQGGFAIAAEPSIPFPTLVDRVLGTSYQPVLFAWRKSPVEFSLLVRNVIELNNFQSSGLGVNATFPSQTFLWHVGIHGIITSATNSSELVSKTPFTQAGRPSRAELAGGFDFPLAEGIITTQASILPALQMVFLGNASMHYLFYRANFHSGSVLDSIGGLFKYELDAEQIKELRQTAPSGMYIEPKRIIFYAGMAIKTYYSKGVFLTLQAQLAPSIFASRMGYAWNLSTEFGYALPY